MTPAKGRSIPVLALGAAVLTSGVFAPGAEAVIRRPERQVAGLVNGYRRDNGRGRLVHSERLHRVAERNSRRMADRGTILHTDLDDIPCRGQKGEVAGRGGNVWHAFRNLKSSPEHRAVILRPDWEKMGVGVVRGQGVFTYVTIVFCG